MIKIFIVDDHGLMREGLKEIIAGDQGIQVVGEAADGQGAVDKIGCVDCDILMMDMLMPGMGGIELIRIIRSRKQSLPILVLSMYNEGKIAVAALKAGANGYLTKAGTPEQLVEAIHKVSQGGWYIDPCMVNKVIFDAGCDDKPPHECLSERERQIFFMIVAGKSTGEIAGELYLSAKTISTHKKRIMEKIGSDNVADLVRYAVKHCLSG